mmetsp:Transcript_45875/g.133547  ORF Transcript_45875/g.133547 Transcript_45875/m.133547 type:complete len:95 (-) Transcript_45875:354-638(-)
MAPGIVGSRSHRWHDKVWVVPNHSAAPERAGTTTRSQSPKEYKNNPDNRKKPERATDCSEEHWVELPKAIADRVLRRRRTQRFELTATGTNRRR